MSREVSTPRALKRDTGMPPAQTSSALKAQTGPMRLSREPPV
jgi:hypothetical protein